MHNTAGWADRRLYCLPQSAWIGILFAAMAAMDGSVAGAEYRVTNLGGLAGDKGNGYVQALAINPSGTTVVGRSEGNAGMFAVNFGGGGTPTDLGNLGSPFSEATGVNDSGWSIRSASGISQNGSIAAIGNFKGGEDQAVLLTPVPSGDVNFDGTVNFSDLVALAQNYGKPGGWAQGDFNGDGNIGFDDLVILAANYGDSQAAAAPVPEPGVAASAFVGLAAFVACRSRKRRWS